MPPNQTPNQRLKDITDKIEAGIVELFASDKYTQYLKTMSRFHNYSFNNTLLIAMQNPEATLVAGYNKWKTQFSRNVKKGEVGIKIIAPVPLRSSKPSPSSSPSVDNTSPTEKENSEPITVFRAVSVFDVSQTEGKPLPTIVNSLSGRVKEFSTFMQALAKSTPVPISFEEMPSNTDGYFHTKEQRIAIRKDMSEVQTLSAAIHEIAHSILHNHKKTPEPNDPTATVSKKTRNTQEVEAESISYAVCNYYGIETKENSFGYIAGWSRGKELKELKESLNIIYLTSSELITKIDSHFLSLEKSKENSLNKSKKQKERER